MFKPLTKKTCVGRRVGRRFVMRVWAGSLAILIVAQVINAQNNSSVWLFRLDGSFGVELPANMRSPEEFKDFKIGFRSAKLESDSMGVLTRIRSGVTLSNGEPIRRIIEVEWRLDLYDEVLKSQRQSILQSEKLNIYPGETATAQAKFGGVLPDRMVALLQVVRISFDDGSVWTPATRCSLDEDLRSITCKRE